jgi:hypothetical protein
VVKRALCWESGGIEVGDSFFSVKCIVVQY